MIEIPSTKESLDSLFYYFAHCYDEKRSSCFKAVCQFFLTEDKKVYSYYISIENGKAHSCEGEYSSPDVKVKSSVDDFFRLLNRELNPYLAFLFGAYKVEGSFFCLWRLKDLFRKKFDEKIITDLRKRRGVDKTKMKFEKVLVINASPRKKEGFTYFYLKPFIDGIKDAGCSVEIIDLYEDRLNISYCRGCFSCFFKTGGRCIINDDANDLIRNIADSDLIVFAFPLYTGLFPGKLLTLLNRCLVFLEPYCYYDSRMTMHPVRTVKEQRMVVFSTSAWPEKKQFEACVNAFQSISKAVQIDLVGCILRPAGESLFRMVAYRDFLKGVLVELRKAGSELAKKGQISKYSLKKIARPFVPTKNWRNSYNLYFYAKEQDGITKD